EDWRGTCAAEGGQNPGETAEPGAGSQTEEGAKFVERIGFIGAGRFGSGERESGGGSFEGRAAWARIDAEAIGRNFDELAAVVREVDLDGLTKVDDTPGDADASGMRVA